MNVSIRFAGFTESPLNCERQPVFVLQCAIGNERISVPASAQALRSAGFEVPSIENTLACDRRHTLNNQCGDNEPKMFTE